MKRFFIIVIIISIILHICPVFAQEIDEIEFNEYIIMPETLMYRILNNDTDFVIYDIRPFDEFINNHIVESINHTWINQDFQNSMKDYPRNRDIFLIDEDGNVSLKALRYLLEKGFSRVWVIEGGMNNWLYKDLIEK